MEEIGAALDTVRKAGKPVLTWGALYSDDAVLLAAHSSEVWVDPMGGAFILGPGGNGLYFGRLLEKLKVNAHVFKVGTFKDYVEQYTRNDQSPESKQARQAVYEAVWSDWKADVAKARPRANITLATTDPAAWIKASGGDIAQAAKAAGLVDRIGTRVQFGERVAALVGADPLEKRPGSFVHTPISTWVEANKERTGGKAIGVVTIAGEIVDG
jgi:protease-4